jgi:tetratricopeptide (TPR) repeat protein
MSEEVNDEGQLRKYLLGELNEAEQQTLEERLLTDGELLDLLLVAEDELIDDYLSGAISASERGRFDGFFLSTPERRRKLSFAMAFRRYVTTEVIEAASQVVARPSAWWKQGFSVLFVRLAPAPVIVLGLIVLGLVIGTWRVFFYQSEVAKGTAALARAYSTERPVEPRITGFGYAPLPNTRGGEQGKVDELSLKRAELILLNEVAEHPSPEAHHALGRVYLAKKEYRDAIDQFEEALKGAPNSAQVHSDYGAALLEMGKTDEAEGRSASSPEKFDKALKELNRAIELDSSRLEPLFNLALCRQKMRLFQQAKEAWERYLGRDATSKWADEARQSLNTIEEQRQRSSRS